MITIGKKGKDRAPSRPVDEVFGSKMESAYGNWLSLFGKVKSLSRHRALRSEAHGERMADNLNRFIGRMVEELQKYTVQPGTVSTEAEEQPLEDFLQ